MAIIVVNELRREFSYYEKAAGLGASLRGLFARRKLLKRAVDGISFSIEQGECVGFLGPNGAGKTTSLKILAGIMPPSSGSALVGGYVPWQRKKDYRMSMSIVMGQRSQLWPDLPAMETFELNRAIYEIDRQSFRRNLDELVASFGLAPLLGVQVRRLSLGERMKMEIVAALLHRPKVLFLDEPTIGLDILSQRAIRDIVRRVGREWGTTVMLTSHYLSDIEDLCERVILINKGRLAYDGSLAGVNADLGGRKRVRLEFSEAVDPARLAAEAGFCRAEGLSASFELSREEVREFSRRVLAEYPVQDLNIEDTPIEEGIIRLYRGGVDG